MPSTSHRRRAAGPREFIALLAMSMALVALGIDLMLPAFAAMRGDLGLPADSSAIAATVTAYLFGLAAGQLVYGPLSDRIGRRPTLFVGFGIYAVGALLSAAAPTLPLLLLGRFVWGLGAAGPRVVTLAMVRDRFHGERMSRAMSFIMAIFIVVPVVAPTLGAAVVLVASWRLLFVGCFLAAAGMTIWGRRIPETLASEHRLELRLGRIARAGRAVVTHRETAGYTLAMTAVYGAFTSYLASSEIIFGETFGVPGAFPLLFGGLAAVMGLGMLLNARVVGAVGTRRLAHVVLLAYVGAAGVLVATTAATGGRPPLPLFLVGLAAMLGCHALLIPNFNTIAMAPMADIAGTASSVIGAVQLAVGAGLGALLDRAFDGTVLPLSLGFLGYGVLALALVLWVERGRLFRPLVDPRRAAEPTVEA